MKIKNMKLMLLGLLAMGGINAFAQTYEFNDGTFKYVSIDATLNTTKNTGEVQITGVQNPFADQAACTIPGTTEYTVGGKTWKFTVTTIKTEAFKNELMGSVSIPAEMKEIGEKAFVGCTHLKTLTFAADCQVASIGDEAFATTQIAVYDFRTCVKLTELKGNGTKSVFLENGKSQNGFVTTIYLPTTTTFKNINQALAKLPNLATLNIADSKIQSVAAKAFENDAKLTKMELPGTVKTIANEAFAATKVADLTINVASIEEGIGGGTQGVYGTDADDLKVLKKLTLKGKLKGKVMTAAFKGSAELATLDMSLLTFGTTGQIADEAFMNCAKLTSVSIGDITDNDGSKYTIAKDAFAGCEKLETVTIGNITTTKAIDAAFPLGTADYALKNVTIGNVYANGAAINKGAFVFPDKVAATLTIGNVRSTDATNAVFADEAFEFKGTAANKATAAITIGAVEAKGNNFVASTFKGTVINSLTFTGDIEQFGLTDGTDPIKILTDNSALATLTFKGKIGEAGIGDFTGLYSDVTDADPTKWKGATVNFEGELAAGSIVAKSFTIATIAKSPLTVNYTATIEDATYNPFDQLAFAGATENTLPTELTDDTKRTVTLNISNTDLAALIEADQITYTDATNGKFDCIYAVKLLATADATTFVVYQKGDTNTSYGRMYIKAGSTDFGEGLEIARRQNGITYTLYTTYVEDDKDNKVVTINMQPMVSTDGKYYIPKAAYGTNGLVVLIKAVKTTESETEVEYTEYSAGTSSVQFTDYAIQVADAQITNEQLCDGSSSLGDLSKKDIYFLSNPANHKGITANTWDHRTNHDVYVAEGSFYVAATHYDGASAARIVWLDGSEETTGISTVKSIANEGVIYNLAGQKVDANYKGVVIKNGKKMIQK